MSRHLYILFRSIAIAINPFAISLLYMIKVTNNISSAKQMEEEDPQSPSYRTSNEQNTKVNFGLCCVRIPFDHFLRALGNGNICDGQTCPAI